MSHPDPSTPIGILDAICLGIVEGLTEFLPVSSTGHLIVAERLLGVGKSPMTVGIQLGAISAVLVLYRSPLIHSLRSLAQHERGGSPNLLLQILIAAAPAAVLGLLCDDWIEARLFTVEFVAGTMAIGGILLLWMERWLRSRETSFRDLPGMGYGTAAAIGCFQCLALLPGTSRSGATIAGALLLGLSRTAAAEFSFLVGLPILYGAGALTLFKNLDAVRGPLLWPLLTGTAVSFLTALVVVGRFVDFLRRNTFAPFAYYRLVAGGLLAGACSSGWM